MTKDDPAFPRGAYVFVNGKYDSVIGTVEKAITGRSIVRVNINERYRDIRSFPKEIVKVVTKENDPELFI